VGGLANTQNDAVSAERERGSGVNDVGMRMEAPIRSMGLQLVKYKKQ